MNPSGAADPLPTAPDVPGAGRVVVVSLRAAGELARLRQEGWHLVYIGRPMRRALPGGLRTLSALGNPYRLPAYTREDALTRYATWLREQIVHPDSAAARAVAQLREVLAAGGRLGLVCFCAPLACHGDVLRELLSAQDEGQAHPDCTGGPA